MKDSRLRRLWLDRFHGVKHLDGKNKKDSPKAIIRHEHNKMKMSVCKYMMNKYKPEFSKSKRL